MSIGVSAISEPSIAAQPVVKQAMRTPPPTRQVTARSDTIATPEPR